MKNIIQIGCNIGQDHVQQFLTDTQNSYSVILIDANPICLIKCEESYKELLDKHKIVFVNFAIVSDPDLSDIDIYIPNNDDSSVFSSTSEHHASAHSHTACNKINVKACTLNKLLEQYNISELEYLYIDTEGLCVDNLLSLDFSNRKIDNIVFEHIHSDGLMSHGGPKLDALKIKLSENGYSLSELGYNIHCTKEYHE